MITFVVVLLSLIFFALLFAYIDEKGEVNGVALLAGGIYVTILGTIGSILEVEYLRIDNFDRAIAVQEVVEDYQIVELNGEVTEVTLTDKQGNSYTLKGETEDKKGE